MSCQAHRCQISVLSGQGYYVSLFQGVWSPGAHDRGEIPLIPSQRMTLSHGRGVDFDALIIQVLSNLECRVGLV